MDNGPWQELTGRAGAAEAEGFSGILRVSRSAEVLWESCHGPANRAEGTAVHVGTRFATASMSKMLTAVAVVDAAQRGEVALDAPVVDVLPQDRRPSTLRPDVTVHHLLSHTSGIADYFEEDENLPGYREDYGALWRELPVYEVRDYAALLPLFGDLPPVCPPGEAFHYSNAGYVLLGLLLQEVTGRPFTEAVTERVLVPAGMTASGYLAADEVHPDVAVGYLPPAAPGMPWRTNVFSVPAVGGGDGGALVTAADADRFLRAVQGGEVWGPEVSRLVLTRHAEITPRWSAGYGVEIRADGAFGKDGGDPGVFALSRYHPHSDTAAVVLGNVDDDTFPGIWDLGRAVMDAAHALP